MDSMRIGTALAMETGRPLLYRDREGPTSLPMVKAGEGGIFAKRW